MIAVDTNVLLRWVLNDDPRQSPRARRLFDANDEILVTDIVLAETVWVLAGRKYNLGPSTIERMVAALLEDARILFEDGAAVWSALQDSVDTPEIASFADFLIIHRARSKAALLGAPFEGLYTFDEALLRVKGVHSL